MSEDSSPRFVSTLRFCRNLSPFQMDVIETDLESMREMLARIQEQYSLLKEIQSRREKNSLDELHLRLFRIYVVNEKGRRIWSPMNKLFRDLQTMGLPKSVEQDRRSFEAFVPTQSDMMALQAELDEINLEYANSEFREEFGKARDSGSRFPLEGGLSSWFDRIVNTTTEFWHLYPRELAGEGLIGPEDYVNPNPGSRDLLRSILVLGAGAFLVGYDVKKGDPTTIVEALMTAAFLINTSK